MIKAINKRSEFLFPTQYVAGEIPDFDQIQENLIKWVYKYKEENNDIARISNKGGWQSQKKDVYQDAGFQQFHNIIIPLISELLSEFQITLQADLVQMWININGKGAYNVSHRHPLADFSGVIWIKQSPEQGRFIFDNMDVGYRDCSSLYFMNRDYLIKNKMLPEWHPEYKDGTIIIFPAMFTHRVEQNETDEDRISLSFNIKLK